MGWGSTQNTATTQQGTQGSQGLNANLPVQLPWVAQAQQGNLTQAQNMYAQAQRPVYGDAQQAAFMQQNNNQTNAGLAGLSSQLASHGIGDSGAFASGATTLEAGNQANLANYNAQVPLLNRQAQTAGEGQALGLEQAAAAAPPTGNISTSSSTGSNASQGTSDTTSTPGIAGLLTTLGGAAISGLTGGMSGLGGAMGGAGGKGAQAAQNLGSDANFPNWNAGMMPSSYMQTAGYTDLPTTFGQSQNPNMPTF